METHANYTARDGRGCETSQTRHAHTRGRGGPYKPYIDQYVSSSNPPSADPNGGSANPEDAEVSTEPSVEEEVVVVPPANLPSTKRTPLQEKLPRLKDELRKSKPADASAPSWKYFGEISANITRGVQQFIDFFNSSVSFVSSV